MIKTYRPKSPDASPGEGDWGEVWEGQELTEKYLRSVAWDGYPEIFARYLAPGSLVLEAGCGLGKYLIYLKRAGYRVIGIDLEEQALSRAQAFESGLTFGVADISALPFRSGAFDVYVSLGVAEHFEAGPGDVLAEARRVLRKGGLALISVPYQHFLKDLSLRLAPSENHRFVDGFTLDREVTRGKNFYQYAFTRQEIFQQMHLAGFRVLGAHPCSRLHWFLNRAPVRWLRARRKSSGENHPGQGSESRISQPLSSDGIGRFQVVVPVLQRLVPGWLSGHMLMVVARRE
jgi:SAM-dependent methyltransferase